jgi:antitoxin ParD1/3/4
LRCSFLPSYTEVEENAVWLSLNITLPEALGEFVDDQVAKGNYGTVSEYLQALIREAQRREAKAELEAKLLEGLQSPASEMTADDWAELKQRVLVIERDREKQEVFFDAASTEAGN